MRSLKLGMFVLLMLAIAAPVFSGDAVQMWRCEMDDEADEEMVEAHAKAWLAAAKKLDGGANLEAFVLFPVAVNATGQMDFMFVVKAPTFAEWGQFWDSYIDSEAGDLDEESTKLFVCPDSVLWDSFVVE